MDSTAVAPLVSIIVPVFNEAASIECVQTRLLRLPIAIEILVVDDGSADATGTILRSRPPHDAVRILTHARNQGKGAAIRTALPLARGHFTVVQDGDLETDPDDILPLVARAQQGDVDAVYGSRYLEPRLIEGRPSRMNWWGVRMLNACVLWLYGVRLTDEATVYKVFPTDVLRAMALECRRFEFCPEVTAKACRLGCRIGEVPIRYMPRTTEQGKKLRLRDGLIALRTLWKYRHWRPATPLESCVESIRRGAGELAD